MKEISNVRQIAGEHRRRWFTNAVMDLIVWLDDGDVPIGFQLCYDKGQAERALTWSALHGFSHMKVDDGESMPGVGYKATPMLTAGAALDSQLVIGLFNANDARLPQAIAQFVRHKLGEFSAMNGNADRPT